ncbi:M42 family metallopeptidase [Alicyclobacillus sp. ALC3]|uniref:M42 family metallopeptidase n=1 Tax=Alicyclobacillus sp. ALC3 TaxID=2796143 RepID=UPI002378F3AC|nr:M42 family metallopeptidase [Alicyclobacillus sp. ALC3]WDL97198.1 M42 family metallopeptidase [Alicyclobacillus sp. ALC3]
MLLKTLTEAFGPSGFEDDVRSVIRTELQATVDHMETDVLGNLFVQKLASETEEQKHQPRVMLDAHMDEVGLMVVHIEDNGLLKFQPIGGVDSRILLGKTVIIGKQRISGVIGFKPFHLQSHEENQKVPKIEDLYIDIGVDTRQAAEALVARGTPVVFATAFEFVGDRAMKAKSFDDRIGCAVLVEVLKQSVPLTVHGVFAVQEEIGLRGAEVAGYRVQPDIAIALEGTVCSDGVGTPSHRQATILGAGPALTVQDARTIADRRFLEFVISVAEKHDVPYQLRRVKAGSNDFGAIHQARGGVIGGGISVPVRYIHAPSQIASLDDFENTVRLVRAVLTELAAGGFQL